MTVDLDLVDRELVKRVIEEGGNDVIRCFQCGSCTADCPSAGVRPYNVRRIVRASILGVDELSKDSKDIWDCTTCYICQERCPQDAKPTDVIVALRRIYAREHGLLPGTRKACANVWASGHTLDLDEDVLNRRERLGLPRLPPTTLTHPEAQEELRRLIAKRRAQRFFEDAGNGHVVKQAAEAKEAASKGAVGKEARK